MSTNIQRLTELYRLAAIGTADISNPRKANKCQADMHACYKILRETEEGRESISGLIGDTEPSVRCWAAAHSLQWKTDVARQALEMLRDSEGPYSFTAQMTLQEFDAGRLSFDY